MERFASIDIGTNSALLLVAERTGSILEPISQKTATPRVGRNLAETGLISPEAFQALMDALADFKKAISESGATLVGAVATQAFRVAGNGPELLEKISVLLGLEAKIIAGPEESRLSYLAVSNRHPSSNLVVLDIGGGSTEVTRKGNGMSLPIGAVGLFESAGSNPDLGRAGAKVALHQVLDGWKGNADVVAVGGTATALAMLLLKMPAFDSKAIEGFQVKAHQVTEMINFLAGMDESQRSALPGMDPGRLDILLPGLCILETVLRQLGTDQFRVSDRGIRYGVILDWIKKNQIQTKRDLP